MVENTLVKGKTATSYIGDKFNFTLKPNSDVVVSARGETYYSNSQNDKNVVSRTQMFGIGIEADSKKFEIAGNTWKVIGTSDFPKSMTIKSEGGQTVVLEDGKRINLEAANGKNKDWKVAFAKTDNIYDVYQNKSNGTEERVWVYRDGNNEKCLPGDGLNLPAYFGGKFTYDGLVNNEKYPLTVKVLKSDTYELESTASHRSVTGPAIEFTAETPGYIDGYSGIEGSTTTHRVQKALLVFAEDGTIPAIFLKDNADKYSEGGFNPGMLSGSLDYISIGWGKSEVRIRELARPSTKNQAGSEVALDIPISEMRNSNGTRELILAGPKYTGIGQTQPFNLETGFITERGSEISSWGEKSCNIFINCGSVGEKFGIAKTKWTLEDGPTTTGIKDIGTPVPTDFQLKQNYPNPFNPATTIPFTMKKDGNVKIKVYNTLGQEIATLANEPHVAGQHYVRFDGSNFASGVYLTTLEIDGQLVGKGIKMNLVK
ncbi:MAG: T9SS type A sorting domain-containing protein [Candidatus Micrarchaeia archaeon]